MEFVLRNCYANKLTPQVKNIKIFSFFISFKEPLKIHKYLPSYAETLDELISAIK